MRFSTATIAAVAALLPALSFAKDGRTFAVMRFQGPDNLLTSRVDPIVSPGGPAGHMHTIQGGNAFSMNMPGTTANTATCTTAKLNNDKSNYWTPSLFFNHGNGTFEPVELFYMQVYYFFESTDDKIQAFPPGFRMVSGDAMLRSPPSSGDGGANLDPANGPIQAVGFTCPRSNTNSPLYPTNSNGMNGVGLQDPNNKGAGVGFPDQNCDGYASPLRADIHFPSCYNPAAGPEAYQSNTQFPTKTGASKSYYANCPAGWIHTPHLFFEVYWNTPKFANLWTPGQGKQPFVLSNGDPTGYSLHGDFINGWDTNTLQTIIDTCDAGDSGMDKCPQIPGGINGNKGCPNMVNPLPENMSGTMAKLPGCNPIQAGPAAATKQTCNGSGSSPVVGSSPSASSPSKATSTAAASTPLSTNPSATKPSTTAVYNPNPKPTTMATVTKPATASTTPVRSHVIHKTRTHTHHKKHAVGTPAPRTRKQYIRDLLHEVKL